MEINDQDDDDDDTDTEINDQLGALCHKKSGSLLLLLYLSHLVNWISTKLLIVFLTTPLQHFLIFWGISWWMT